MVPILDYEFRKRRVPSLTSITFMLHEIYQFVKGAYSMARKKKKNQNEVQAVNSNVVLIRDLKRMLIWTAISVTVTLLIVLGVESL